MTKNTLLPLLGAALGFGFSFLGVGLLWIAVPLYAQAGLGGLFALAGYILARSAKNFSTAAASLAVGASPLALLLVQFRDKENSHLVPILLVAGWYAGLAIGAGLGFKSSRG
jgi:hypothetical protein